MNEARAVARAGIDQRDRPGAAGAPRAVAAERVLQREPLPERARARHADGRARADVGPRPRRREQREQGEQRR